MCTSLQAYLKKLLSKMVFVHEQMKKLLVKMVFVHKQMKKLLVVPSLRSRHLDEIDGQTLVLMRCFPKQPHPKSEKDRACYDINDKNNPLIEDFTQP